MKRKYDLLRFIVSILMLAGCSSSTKVIEYPPLDWAINGQRLKDLGCVGKWQESCPALSALGCDEINTPSFYLGGLQPPYTVMECIHETNEPPNKEYFKKLPGLDTRYRSYAIDQDGTYRLLIKKSEFKEIFAPIESTDEAISYAMATPVGAHDGVIAAMNALSDAHRKVDHRVIPRVIFTDPQAAMVGQTDEEAVGTGIRCWCGTIPL
ncbi:MAG: hypothetical protein ACPL1K_03640, partial [Candidatus Kryptoniota bacterium]